MENDRYDYRFMAAYIRGMMQKSEDELFTKPLESFTEQECRQLMKKAEEAGLKLHYFKQFEELPRVKMVLGFLRGVQPMTLLDVGSGRGVFLFPFLRAFPWTSVTSLDLLPGRVEMMQAIHDGGIGQLTALQADVCTWDAPQDSFDTVTMLEVLEHIPDVQAAVSNAVRLARQYVVVTVPSKPDNNPEHIHLLTRDILTDLFKRAGCKRLSFDGVPGHLFMIAHVAEKR